MTLEGLYAITPELTDTADLLRRVDAALAGGARLLQYRNKTADPQLRRQQAAALLARCRAHGVPLILNDDLALAQAIDADGVHLGRDDAALAAARAALGARKLIGVSCYDDLALAHVASEQGADYLAFGSFFASPTKPLAVRPPLTLLREARARFGLPICAIGGIRLDNAGELIAAGANLLAVISDLFEAEDIRARAAAYASLFAEQPSS